MSTTPPGSERDDELLEELLADRAVFGLDTADQAELSRLLGADDNESFELTAAALLAADQELAKESVPAGLRARLSSYASGFDFAAAREQPARAMVTPKRDMTRDAFFYSLFALAASALLAMWLGSPPASRQTLLAEARQAFLSEAPDAITIAWQATDDPAVTTTDEAGSGLGDVVWDTQLQQGFMRFRGLAMNDPAKEQYQLWVFDSERDDRYPVDGGVFNVETTPSGETIVPISATLHVSDAVMFAITVEKPGGVVVSDRSRLPLLAKR